MSFREVVNSRMACPWLQICNKIWVRNQMTASHHQCYATISFLTQNIPQDDERNVHPRKPRYHENPFGEVLKCRETSPGITKSHGTSSNGIDYSACSTGWLWVKYSYFEGPTFTPNVWNNFTIMTSGCQGVSNNSQIDCLFNSLFSLITKKTPKLRITCSLRGESMHNQWFLLAKCQWLGKCLHVVTSNVDWYLQSTEVNVLRSIHNMKEPKGGNRVENDDDPTGHSGIPGEKSNNITLKLIKMTDNLQTTFPSTRYGMKKQQHCILIKISQLCFPSSAIHNKQHCSVMV